MTTQDDTPTIDPANDGTPEPESVSTDAPTSAAMSNPSSAPKLGSDRSLNYGPGDVIGRYTIRGTLGEGGMGAVYLADQSEPVKRTVALKVIKPGMDSKAVVSRFEAERQALAVMDHPSIAKIYDGGTTDRGLPYFVMEHVKGVPITEHCDQQKLDLQQRLSVFIKVCEGVQHAHSKGVIHRDLKPGNILVAYQGDEHAPKIIDFGIAKAVNASLSDSTLFTQQGALVGTPEYMSPEQAGTSAQDIDTRSDVYALGVILYELLTGVRPFDADTLKQAALGEIQRIIREVDPPKPSTRLISFASAGDLGTRIASARRTDTKSLGGTLKRDLDWVVMKCLEKDRARRYDTASALAMEVHRYLHDEPVLAGPPSAGYKLSKFVKRNRAGVAAGSAVALALVVSTAVSVRFGLSERDARRTAETERLVSGAIGDFLNQDLLQAVDPDTDGPDVTVVEILDRAAASLERRFDDRPEVEGRVAASLGNAYLSLGFPAKAEPLLRRASDKLGLIDGAKEDRWLVDVSHMESLWRRGEIERAISIGERLEEQTGSLGESDPLRFDVLNQIAAAYKRDGRLDEAEEIYARVLAGRTEALGAEHLDTMRSEYNLALMPILRGVGLQRETEDQTDNEAAGAALIETGLEQLRAAHAKAARVLGNDHSHTLICASEVCSQLNRLGRLDEAEPMYRELLAAQERKLGAEHWRRRQTLANFGRLLQKNDRHAEARVAYEQCLPGYRESSGVDAPDTVTITMWLADATDMDGDFAASLSLLERSWVEVSTNPGLAARIADLGITISERNSNDRAGVWRERRAGLD